MPSNFDTLAAGVNSACLRVFGDEALTYTPVSGDDPYTLPSGIITSASILEPDAPGTYFELLVLLSDLEAAPAAGDKVTDGSRIYSVYEIGTETDGGGVTLKLQLQ